MGLDRLTRRRLMRQASGDESAVWGRQPVHKLTAHQLFEELVKDAEDFVPTPMRRMMPAITRIAQQWRSTPEKVFRKLTEEAAARRGDTRMPGVDPSYRTTDSQ